VAKQEIPAVNSSHFYFGNAADDNVADTGWFVGQFIPDAMGYRHQTAVELKWGVHPRGQSRPGGPEANRVATTISILVRGMLETVLTVAGQPHVVRLEREGDYIVFGPDVKHDWEALEDSIVLSVRFPSVDVWDSVQAQRRRPATGV
jgi:hypothetical protein